VRSDWAAQLSIGLGVSVRRLIVAGTGVDAAVVGVLDFGDGIGELYE